MQAAWSFDGAHWLECHSQRLCLLPSAGGSVAAWQWQRDHQNVDLWRPWDGRTMAMGALASFPLLPWSNRIGGGGFEHAGRFHPLKPNTPDDPYPIHGDGWQQPWTLVDLADDRAAMVLRSERFGGNPHVYEARQTFALSEGGMRQTTTVTNRGPQALPFGLGQHPWFPRTPDCRVTARVQGAWMSRPDRIPTGYTTEIPADWNLNQGVAIDRTVIDNGFGGWDGEAQIEWPGRNVALSLQGRLTLPDGSCANPDCLLYAPEAPPVFCLEPVSHPVNAAHWPGRPGWSVLAPDQSMTLHLQWRFGPLAADR